MKKNSWKVGVFTVVGLILLLTETCTKPAPVDMAINGRNIYYTRCVFCHKLSGERLVCPGLKGVTNVLSEKWMMNTFTHLDRMVKNDSDIMVQFKADCGLKGQGKNLTEEQAHQVIEFLKLNDADTTGAQ